MVKYTINIWSKRLCYDVFAKTKKGVYFCPKKLFKSHKCLDKCRCGNDCCTFYRNKQYISTHVKHLLT